MPNRKPLAIFVAATAIAMIATSCGSATPTTSSETGTAEDGSTGTIVDPVERGDAFNTLDPTIVSTSFVPPAVLGTDGKFHLAYEVQVTNIMRENLDLLRVAASQAGDDDTPLSALEGNQLTAQTNAIGQSEPTTSIVPSSTLVTFMDALFDTADAVPAKMDNDVTTAAESDSTTEHTTRRTFRVATQPVKKLGNPLKGERWVVGEGCCEDTTHHRRGIRSVNGREVLPERFAMDFIQVDENNLAFSGDVNKNENWIGWGQEILAVADGTVFSTLDEQPTNTVFQSEGLPSTVPEGGGNQVILDIGDSQFAGYMHMQAGSLKVKPGDSVKKGDVLGLLGNSGHSGAPHLHFQVATTPSIGSGEGLPFVFESFDYLGRYESLLDVVPDDEKTGVPPQPAEGPKERKDQMPLNVDLISFSD